MTMSGNEGMAPIGAHPDVVRVAGLEPALLSEQDFESSASTNSTTPAQVWEAAQSSGGNRRVNRRRDL
jgi:hypothetical protein